MPKYFSPSTTPMDSSSMNGLLLPRLEPQRSDMEPRMGVRKKPTRGDRHQIRVMCSWWTPETCKTSVKACLIRVNKSSLVSAASFYGTKVVFEGPLELVPQKARAAPLLSTAENE